MSNESGLSAVMNERRQLINLAYRMLGSLADAEDVVQETYARWYAQTPARREAVDSPGAWLTTVASRICLDVLGSARARRERYVGAWIPEPLPDLTGSGSSDPADRVTLDESVNMAFLVVLESMTPAERVAFVLHDVFRYPFPEVAEIVGRSPAACRQLASSGRRRLTGSRAPVRAEPRHADVVRAFQEAWAANDVNALITVLDPDALAVADGGGVVTAYLDPVHGSARIARMLLDVAAPAPGFKILERSVNGRPGVIAQLDGVTVVVMALHVENDRITNLWAVRNPDKLRPWIGA